MQALGVPSPLGLPLGLSQVVTVCGCCGLSNPKPRCCVLNPATDEDEEDEEEEA